LTKNVTHRLLALGVVFDYLSIHCFFYKNPRGTNKALPNINLHSWLYMLLKLIVNETTKTLCAKIGWWTPRL